MKWWEVLILVVVVIIIVIIILALYYKNKRTLAAEKIENDERERALQLKTIRELKKMGVD
jgi:uncharacterized membrane protein